MPVYMAVARALESAGCKILRPLDGERLEAELRHRGNRVRFFDGVGVLADGANLYHTHHSWPMERLLEHSDPELVLADHGFAGAAIAQGVETLAFNDINDPSLSVAKARGMTQIVVPLDDNVRTPDAYTPIGDVLVNAIRSA
ncbi:MAG: phosphatase [Actinobacteria bacterium]|nr:phosphatase [Actinomycetota bacterium]